MSKKTSANKNKLDTKKQKIILKDNEILVKDIKSISFSSSRTLSFNV